YRKGWQADDEENLVIKLKRDDSSVVIGSVSAPSEVLEVGGNMRVTNTITSDSLYANSVETGSLTSESLSASSGSVESLTGTTIEAMTTNTIDATASGAMVASGNISTEG